MAKMVPYRSDRNRKLGFRRARQEKTGDHQLNLFQQNQARQRSIQPHQKGRHFAAGLEHDGINDDLAASHYKQAIEHQECIADAHCNLGIMYARAGQTAKAVDSFSKALCEDPRHLEGHFNLGNMYFDMGNHKLAASHYEIASEIDDSLPDVQFNLALALLDLKENQSAKKALTRYLDLCPQTERKVAERLLLLLSLEK